MEQKTLLGVEIKDEAKGEFEAVFATFNEVDSDGDVTLPGAFDEGAPVRISAYGHASWGPSRGAASVPIPPVGKGLIHTSEVEATVAGQFFLKTAGGRDTFELVKEMGDLQEWSYGYDVLDSAPGDFKGQRVRFLRRQKVHEISPVLVGAGVRTRTLAVKGKILSGDLRMALEDAGRKRWGGDRRWVWVDDFDLDESWAVFSLGDDTEQKYLRVEYARDESGAVKLAESEEQVERTTAYRTKGESFPDEAERVLGGVQALVTRVEGWGSGSETKEGRVLSAANRERVTQLVTSLGEASSALEGLLAETDPGKQRAIDEALEIESNLAMAAARLRL